MFKKYAPFLPALLLCLSLFGCTKLPSARRADNTKQNSPYTMPAEAYLALAQNQPEGEQQNMRIMAAGRYIQDTQYQQAESILNQIAHLTETQLAEKYILLATIKMTQGQPQAAVSYLAMARNVNHLPHYYQREYHESLASAYEETNNFTDATNERIKLNYLLEDNESQVANWRKLWLDLTRLPASELNTLAIESDENRELVGWVQLALIARQPTSQGQTLLMHIETWQQQYPGHPANNLLPLPLSSAEALLNGAPHHIALLLPMTGPLAGPGTAVRDGVMAGYSAAGAPSFVHIQTYDTSGVDVRKLYEQAIADGADYVIGPLTKADVSTIAKMDHPVPTIFLNDTEGGGIAPGNAYLFGLFPTNEARQVAYRAHKKGLHQALIIAPVGSWGNDIVSAFEAEWHAFGGVVADSFRYDDQTDLNAGLRSLLRVSEREAKQKQLHTNASSKAKSMYQKRRQDFDMVFLVAYPSIARQIVPLLRYYFAGNIPVYATSSVYSGHLNTLQDKDLDGVIFCDISWVFNHQLPNKNWPESYNSYSRLYALGLDSYALGTGLNRLIIFPAITLEDTEVVYLNRAHQIARILAWGQFRGGVAEITSSTP